LLYELPDFEVFEPRTLAEALEILGEYGTKAKILAGGTDLLGLMKDRIQGARMPIPSALVDIKGIKELQAIVHGKNESIIGSTVTLSRVSSDQTLSRHFPVFVQAADSVATSQIRNMGTLGGNLAQRPWCWYFRHPSFDCFKKGGKQCYAITGDNSTYFAIYNLGTCVMSHPSDTAPALMALDSKVTIASEKAGVRDVSVSDFFLGPKNVEDNILKPDEILVSVKIPTGSPDGKSVYLKHRQRDNWDFALASVAASGIQDRDQRISRLRLVLGGVAPMPFRLNEVEELLTGKVWNRPLREQVKDLVSKDAKPLTMNRYKVRIVRGLVPRAIDSIFGPS
jgi:xanthine dehydrogenase YagS FAD-binding subunit